VLSGINVSTFRSCWNHAISSLLFCGFWTLSSDTLTLKYATSTLHLYYKYATDTYTNTPLIHIQIEVAVMAAAWLTFSVGWSEDLSFASGFVKRNIGLRSEIGLRNIQQVSVITWWFKNCFSVVFYRAQTEEAVWSRRHKKRRSSLLER
jgi:hypothetical protein